MLARQLIRVKKGVVKEDRLKKGIAITKQLGEAIQTKVPKIFLDTDEYGLSPEPHETVFKLAHGKEPKPGTKARLRFEKKYVGVVPAKHKVPLSDKTLEMLSHFPTPERRNQNVNEGISNHT